jgi:DNA-binding response OmpR family regulator
MICALLKEALCDVRSEVTSAPTGTLGAEELLSQKFDLALIDVWLPDFSGFILAELASNEGTPVLLMSGRPDSIEQLRRFGFPFISKPLDLQVLVGEARWAMAHGRENARSIIEAVANMRINVQSLEDAVVASHQLVEASRQLIDSATEAVGRQS